MKKHLSVFSLMIRGSFYKFLLLVVGMLALEGALIWRQMSSLPEYENLVWVIERSGIVWVFTAAMAITAYLLCRMGCEYSSKTGYTIRRLSVSEKAVFYWQSLYNTLVIVMLWAIQLAAAFCVCHIYMKIAAPSLYGVQTVFLTFWRVDFFHTLMPLQDTLRTLAVALFIPALGFSTASFSYLQRRGKFAGWVPGTVIFGALLNQLDLDSTGLDVIFAATFILTIGTTISMVHRREGALYED